MAVVGAGPAGALLARLLADSGFRVTVFEGAPRLAAKPCGWGVPYTVESVYRLPEEVVLVKVRGFEVYAGGELVKEGHGRFFGYIVDKAALLGELLEGVEVVRRYVDPRVVEGYDLVVDARGHPAYAGAKALALQVEGRVRDAPEDEIRVYFLSELVGYAWVFPLGDGRAKVGVGGLGDAAALRRILDGLLRSVGFEGRAEVRGSPVASQGLILGSGGVVKIGEAAGAVMPLSGEGIRPSFITARALYEELAGGGSFREYIAESGLELNIRVQLGILRALENSSPEERMRIFKEAPLDLLECVTAGCVTKAFLAKAFARAPRFFARVAKLAGLSWASSARPSEE